MSDTTTFTVNDMTCSHCVGTVTKALEQALPGADITVDLGTHTVRFTGDAQTGKTAIEEAGYTPEA